MQVKVFVNKHYFQTQYYYITEGYSLIYWECAGTKPARKQGKVQVLYSELGGLMCI